jgi:hypothetical protein
MPAFNPPRDRDAWSTIRGYAYQVDLTIQRWLDLAPAQILEIECGEDIDLTGQALIADSEDQKRLLEQVKHRDSAITLKKPEAVSAIANFIEHCQINPDIELIFQYTTNAKVGKEQLSPFRDRIPAIEAWESLRLGSLEGRNQSELLAGIRQILRNAKKPHDLNNDTWQLFRNFIQSATNRQLLDFIQKFQWRTSAPNARSLKSILEQELLNRQYAIDLLQAQEQYQRLFWYVFNHLGEHGRKQLTIEELNVQISLPSLSNSDHEALEILKSWSHAIDAQIISLEEGQQQLNQLVNSLSGEVQQLTKAYGIDAAINYVVETPILDIYPLIDRASLREETVQSLAQILENHTWLAIDGSLGSGKTQLVVLLVQYLTRKEHCANCKWLRLRDLTTEQACLRFDQAIETLIGGRSDGSRSQWYSQLNDCLGTNTILVFDDLPQLARGDELESRLAQLAQICNGKGIHILSTSFYPLPQNLKSILGSSVLYTKEVPPFTSSEVAELFKSYDAPDEFLNSDWISYLNDSANHHPTSLAAIAVYLHRRHWQFTLETFTSILRGAHTTDINEETLNRILISIQDEQSQELLYRLNLILGYFSPDDIQALADIAPSIERPRQRLNNLFGVWIQRDINNRLMVSPLVKALGSDDLHISVRKECHLTLGERIVRNPLNQFDTLKAITHFIMADAFNQAGKLLLFALRELENCKAQIQERSLLSIWSRQPLPEQMDLGLRILIRGSQICIRVREREPVNDLLSSLDALVEQVTGQESVAMILLVADLVSKCPDQVGFSRLNRCFQLALRLSSSIKVLDGSELSLPHEVPFEYLIWATSRNIQNPTELEDWIATLGELTPEQRQRAFSIESTEIGCLLVAERLWTLEIEKPEVEQNWQVILNATHNLAESSANLGLELLWASAVSSEVIILAEFCKNLNQAIEVAELAITHASEDPRTQFLLKVSMGRQFFFADRYDEAIVWLNEAVAQPTDVYPSHKNEAFLFLSEAIALKEPYLAIQYAQQAVNVARSSMEVSEAKLVKSLGELAIAKWLAVDLSAAFEVWDQAVECLLKYRKDESIWKELFVLYAHCTGYFTALAATGNPPNENYAAPRRGIFLTRDPARIDYYNPSQNCFLPSQIAIFAEALGHDDRALVWAMRGLEMTREAKQTLPLISLSRNIIPQLVLENRYVEVLDLAVEVGALLMAHSQSRQSIPESEIDIQSVLGSRENDIWRFAESSALFLGVVPIVFQIAGIAISQPELARRKALDLATLCREISNQSETQSLWSVAAEIIEQIDLQQSTCKELISQYKNINSPDGSLWILGVLTATLQQNASLVEVLSVHLSIIEKVQKLTNPQSITWRKIVLPYFFNFWKTSLERVTFRFKDPQLTAKLLYAAKKLPPNEQGQTILIIINKSLIT